MLGLGVTDRRAVRHAATKQEIVDAAWRLARERGLGNWSLRDVAEAVGMRAPSLYVYFDSKNALYDAMFAEGNAELVRRGEAALATAGPGAAPADVMLAGATMFVDFCVEDQARYQLLFLRTLPGFEPSEASYALARLSLEQMMAVMDAAGIGAPELVDLWTAILAGLVAQQISNDPGGDRWRRLVVPAVEMFLAVHPPSPRSAGEPAGPLRTIGA
jgi:AcrR family transcriptional regulator